MTTIWEGNVIPVGCTLCGLGAGISWLTPKVRPQFFSSDSIQKKVNTAAITLLTLGCAANLYGWFWPILAGSMAIADISIAMQKLGDEIQRECHPNLVESYYNMTSSNPNLRMLADVAKYSEAGMTCDNLLPFAPGLTWDTAALKAKGSVAWGFTGIDNRLFVALLIKSHSMKEGVFSVWKNAFGSIPWSKDNFCQYVYPSPDDDQCLYDPDQLFKQFQSMGRGNAVTYKNRDGVFSDHYLDQGYTICSSDGN